MYLTIKSRRSPKKISTKKPLKSLDISQDTFNAISRSADTFLKQIAQEQENSQKLAGSAIIK